MENFECTIRQYPVRKVESMNELSESTSCILEYSQFPYEYTSDSDEPNWDQLDLNDAKNRAMILAKSIKVDTKSLIKMSRKVRRMETQYLEIIKIWIKKIFDLQKNQLRTIMKK